MESRRVIYAPRRTHASPGLASHLATARLPFSPDIPQTQQPILRKGAYGLSFISPSSPHSAPTTPHSHPWVQCSSQGSVDEDKEMVIVGTRES